MNSGTYPEQTLIGGLFNAFTATAWFKRQEHGTVLILSFGVRPHFKRPRGYNKPRLAITRKRRRRIRRGYR